MDGFSVGQRAVHRQDLIDAIGEPRVRQALRDGQLAQLWRSIVVDGRNALEPVTRAEAALLACGDDAVLSRRTALALHGCDAALTPAVHITVPYSSWVRSKSGLVVHHGEIRPEEIVTMNGLPVCAIDLAITDVLCTERRRWLALACLDQALRQISLPEGRALRTAVRTRLAARPGGRGVRRAETLLDMAVHNADSPQESRLRWIVVDAGFPLPATQHPVLAVNGALLFLLDVAWPELMIGVEFDGFAAHEGREDYDAERDRRLVGRGWWIIRVRKDDLARPEAFLAELRRAFTERTLARSA